MFTYNVQVRIPTHFGTPSGSYRLTRFYETYDFEVRGITRLEYRQWDNSCKTRIEFEDRVLSEAVLGTPTEFKGSPWNWDDVYFGLVSQLVDRVLEISGFGGRPYPEMLKRAQNYLDGDAARYDRLIMMALHYKLEDLMNMEPELWHMLVGQSQIVLALIGLDPDMVVDPENYKRKTPPPQTATPDIQNSPISRRSMSRGAMEVETQQGCLAFTSG